jgi:O-antigen/teichoic acid export membrane protein/4-amino-4-deoxy-L-arabinose transferase-like glycosyltransferase
VNTSVALKRAAPLRSASVWAALREQATVATGQLAAGVGNMVFALVMARTLAPAGFAELAAFLALYLLIHLPARSLGAATTLAPGRVATSRRHALRVGLVGSLAVLAVGIGASEILRLPTALLGALATTPLLASLIAVERGRLYGESRHRQVVATMLVEPVVRLSAGLALALSWGPEGAAAGVVLSDVAALATARLRLGSAEPSLGARAEPGNPERTSLAPAVAVACFLLVALLQSADVVFANATLPAEDAGRFAALSTLGGIAAFATITIPFVLMPRAQAGERGALGGALASAAALGGVAVIAALVAPGPIIELVFGGRYASLAPVAAPYLLAMALLGIGRVLVANAAATGAARPAAAVLAMVAVAQVALMAQLGGSVDGLASSTLIATALMVVAMTGVTVAAGRRGRSETRLQTASPPLDLERRPTPLPAPPESSPTAPRPPIPAPAPETEPGDRGTRVWKIALLLGGLMLFALTLRLVADRSIWIDEATSWYQSQLPFGTMLDDLRSTDVHPPLYHSLLWLTVRVLGDGELGLRALSIATGVALVPMLFVAGRAMYDRRTGLIAAAFGAFAPVLIWYSHEARMYALLVLLGVVAIWAHHQALETLKARYWVIYPLAAAAMIWTQYFAIFPVAVLQVALLVELWRRHEQRRWTRALAFLGTAAVIAALLAPLAPFALDQFVTNEEAGKGLDQPQRAGGGVEGHEVSPYAGLSNVVWAIWGYHSAGTMVSLVALWPLLVLLAFLMLGRRPSRATWVLIAAAGVPALALTALAVFQPFLFELRFNLTAVPILVLLGARAASAWTVSRLGRAVAVAGVSATLLAGAADQQLNGDNPRLYDFKGSLEEISARAGPGDVVLYDPQFLNNVIEYYAPELDARPIVSDQPLDDANAKRVFVLASFSDDQANVQATEDALSELEQGRAVVDRFSKPQVKVWELR